jgi:NAD(P)-dependent dehydrogenase (short-subunit alcohol dehydrogenase family)
MRLRDEVSLITGSGSGIGREMASDEAGFVVGHVLNVDGGFQAAGLRFDPEAP